MNPRSRLMCVALMSLLLALVSVPAGATTPQSITFPLRGKTLLLSIYRPAMAPKGTIVMAGGDVGWVGLAVSMAEFLSDRGYVVVGINTRQYLTAFTSGREHLEARRSPYSPHRSTRTITGSTAS